MTACGNGDLETLLDLTQWQGAYGALNAGGGSPGNIIFASLTAGILSGPAVSPNDAIDYAPGGNFAFASQAHQRWVGAGPDWNLLQCAPSVNLPKTAPGSSGAVRMGNMVPGGGCELLSKTFIVAPSQTLLTYWYAVVFQNSDPTTHQTIAMPYFRVRVTDQWGNLVPNASNLGAGSDTLLTDPNNPFFCQTQDYLLWAGPGAICTYKPWAAAQINLGSMVGQQVTIEFITADCWHTGHYGYAYIDNLCGDSRGSPEGSIWFNQRFQFQMRSRPTLFRLFTSHHRKTGSRIGRRHRFDWHGRNHTPLYQTQNGIPTLLTTLVSPVRLCWKFLLFPYQPGIHRGNRPVARRIRFHRNGRVHNTGCERQPCELAADQRWRSTRRHDPSDQITTIRSPARNLAQKFSPNRTST